MVIRLDVVNRTKRPIPQGRFFQNIAENVLLAEKGIRFKKAKANVICISVVVVSRAFLRSLNKKWRNKNTSCDELSFTFFDTDPKRYSSGEYFGEIFIALPRAEKREQKRYYAQALTHALLHVFGYNHEGIGKKFLMAEKKMQRIEEDVMGMLGL